MPENDENDIKIARMGHPVLLGRAEEVLDVHAPEVQAVIDRLIACHKSEAGGVGVAAPQLFLPWRIFLFEVTARCAEVKGIPENPMTVVINPEIEVVDHETELDWEGCLSVPGMCGEVSRYKKINYKALDREGRVISQTLEGYAARIIQHECDHLDGILYPTRIQNLRRFGYLDEVREFLIG